MAADDKRKSAHPYIPNSVPSIQARMPETIGASGIEELYETIPEALRFKGRICDHEQTLLKKTLGLFERSIGMDIVVKNRKKGRYELIQADLTKRLPLPARTADVVTMLAVLEHLPNPDQVVKEAYRILKPGGQFLVTVPSAQAELVLPFFAKVGIVRKDMVVQHENYFSHASLKKITKAAGFKKIEVRSWELGFNTFMCAIK